MPLRRMDAEQLHDSILLAAGRLDPTLSANRFRWTRGRGRNPGKRLQERVAPQHLCPAAAHHADDLLEVFDLPPMSPNCIERANSTVSTQALQMMNSEMFANAPASGRPADGRFPGQREKQIERLYLRTLARRPTAGETARALAGYVDNLNTSIGRNICSRSNSTVRARRMPAGPRWPVLPCDSELRRFRLHRCGSYELSRRTFFHRMADGVHGALCCRCWARISGFEGGTKVYDLKPKSRILTPKPRR